MTRVIVAIVLLAAAVVGVLLWTQSPRGPVTVSGIIEAHDIRVGSRVGGRVREVHVREGDRAQAGQTLVTLEAFDLAERLAEAQAEWTARRANLQKLQAGYVAEEIAQARATCDRYRAVLDRLETGLRPLEFEILEDKLAVAQADLRKAEADYDRVRALFERGEAASQENTDAVRALDVARARLSQAEDELALAREGTRAEELAEARAQLAAANAARALLERGYREEDIAQAEAMAAAAESRMAAIQRQLDELRIVAPDDVVVESIDLKPGDLIAANAPVVSLLDMRTLWVRAYVPQGRVGLQLGQKLTVRVDAVPGRTFTGRVDYVSRETEFTPANAQTPEERSKQVFRIKVVLDEGLDVLRAGMTVDVVLEP